MTRQFYSLLFLLLMGLFGLNACQAKAPEVFTINATIERGLQGGTETVSAVLEIADSAGNTVSDVSPRIWLEKPNDNPVIMSCTIKDGKYICPLVGIYSNQTQVHFGFESCYTESTPLVTTDVLLTCEK